MLELIFIVVFCWLFFKVLGLAFKAAWSVAKIAASVIFALAVPVLVLCLIFAGTLTLIIPIAMIAIAFGILKSGV